MNETYTDINRGGVLKINNKIYLGYLLLLVIFFLIGFSNYPVSQIVSEQVLMWGMAFLFTAMFFRSSVGTLTFVVFLFQLASILYIRKINISLFNDPLGYDPHDALFYRECGEYYGSGDFRTFFVWLIASYGTLDDWGFPSLVWLLYHLFGSNGEWVLLFLNALVISLGARSLYRLALLFCNNDLSRFVFLIWGFAPFAACTAAGGLKENFFAFVVIRLFYNLYRNRRTKIVKYVLLAFDLIGVFLFRLSAGYAAILSILLFSILKVKTIRKNFTAFAIVALLAGLVMFPFVVGQIAGQRGVSYESVAASSSVKAESVGGATGYAVNILSALIGPFPTFISSDEDKINYITRYSFFPYVKMILSFFFYYAFWIAIKRKDRRLYPIYLFVFLNILMISFAFFALNIRFHWPHMALFMMISCLGLESFYSREISQTTGKVTKLVNNERKPILYVLYLFVSFAIVLIYNYR